MSKGHGTIQRRLLDILRNEPREFDAFELAGRVFEVAENPPHRFDTFELAGRVFVLPAQRRRRPWRERHAVSEAQVVSVRRALRQLQREGLVRSSGNRPIDRRQYWRHAAHDADAARRASWQHYYHETPSEE